MTRGELIRFWSKPGYGWLNPSGTPTDYEETRGVGLSNPSRDEAGTSDDVSTDIEATAGDGASASGSVPPAEKPRVYRILEARRIGVEIDGDMIDAGVDLVLGLADEEIRREFADDNFDDIQYQLPGYEFSATALADWSKIVEARMQQAMVRAPTVDPSRYFTADGKTFIRSKLAADLKFDGSVFHVGADRRLWRYTHGVFVPDGEEQLRARVRHFMADRFSKHYASEMLAYVEAETVAKPEGCTYSDTASDLGCPQSGSDAGRSNLGGRET